MTQPKHPALQEFNPAGIPQQLKDLPRWAPWKAIWNVKRQKYDKVPYRADAPQYGLSTARPESWFPFDRALACFDANPGAFNGLGLVMTGLKGFVGTDLDGCIKNGDIAPWAQEIINTLDSYTEVSPSGKGLRIFNTGTQEADWNNHDVGIEVYGGNDARFLTVSGQHIAGTRRNVTPAAKNTLAGIESRYAKQRVKATVIDLNMPEQIDELALPSIADLGLPYAAKDFLSDSVSKGDRSGTLFAASVALYAAGLTDAEVFSVLCASPHSMEVALDHRRQDQERATMYLWREHCLKAKGRATSKIASLDDFDDVSTPEDKAQAATSAAEKATPKPLRFAFSQAAEYLNRKSVEWSIKGVLPKAEIGAIYGESTAGKSFFALDLVMAVATGKPWRDCKVRQGTVAYICAEGASGFTLRIKAYADFHGHDLPAIPFHVLGDTPNFLEKDDIKDLIVALKALGKLDIIVVDTMAQVTPGGNENSGEDMGRALAHCKTLHKATGAMVVIVAHSGKDANKGIRGWSGVKAALDVEICVEREGDNRCATITKLKDGSGEGRAFPFSLDTITMHKDEDGDDVTSCVLKAGTEKLTGKKTSAAVQDNSIWQKVALKSAIELTDLPGDTTTEQLVQHAINQIPKDEEAKKDRRRERILKAITDLSAKGTFSIADGKVVMA